MISIHFLTSLENIADVFDHTLDVIVDLEDGSSYIISIVTQQHVLTLMDGERSDFLSPGILFVIVRKMTKEIIENAIKAYAKEDGGYYLKLYGAELGVKTFDILKDRYIARDKLFDDLREKGKSIDIENYNLIDFNSQAENFVRIPKLAEVVRSEKLVSNSEQKLVE